MCDGASHFLASLREQCSPHSDERRPDRFEDVLERDGTVGLGGDERAIDRGQRDPGESEGHRALGVVAEGNGDLLAQAVEPEAADARDDDLDLVSPMGRRLHGEDDQQAKEVGMALERLGSRREHGRQVLGGTSDPAVPVGEVGEEALGATLHDGEQDAVLGPVVERTSRSKYATTM